MSGPHSVGDHLVDVDWLRKNHTHLHPFGLGFLQSKLNDQERVHFWHPGFVREREEVHDHRYDFFSTILRGEMQQSIYKFTSDIENATHEMFMTDCSSGHEGKQDCVTDAGILIPAFTATLSEGKSYHIHRDTLHRIEAKKCVTFLQRGSKVKAYANVVREVGATSTCPFAEHVPEAEMWAMIEDCLK
jgi:hypothetical protein